MLIRQIVASAVLMLALGFGVAFYINLTLILVGWLMAAIGAGIIIGQAARGPRIVDLDQGGISFHKWNA